MRYEIADQNIRVFQGQEVVLERPFTEFDAGKGTIAIDESEEDLLQELFDNEQVSLRGRMVDFNLRTEGTDPDNPPQYAEHITVESFGTFFSKEAYAELLEQNNVVETALQSEDEFHKEELNEHLEHLQDVKQNPEHYKPVPSQYSRINETISVLTRNMTASISQNDAASAHVYLQAITKCYAWQEQQERKANDQFNINPFSTVFIRTDEYGDAIEELLEPKIIKEELIRTYNKKGNKEYLEQAKLYKEYSRILYTHEYTERFGEVVDDLNNTAWSIVNHYLPDLKNNNSRLQMRLEFEGLHELCVALEDLKVTYQNMRLEEPVDTEIWLDMVQDVYTKFQIQRSAPTEQELSLQKQMRKEGYDQEHLDICHLLQIDPHSIYVKDLLRASKERQQKMYELDKLTEEQLDEAWMEEIGQYQRPGVTRAQWEKKYKKKYIKRT